MKYLGEPPVEVAVAVVLAPDGRVLLTRRPAGKPYAGYWEFPGGKVEAGETAAVALVRELEEELGIRVHRAHPWLTQTFVYPHATVRLCFFRVMEWGGAPKGREGQALSWEALHACRVSPLLPANGPILRALQLSSVYAISAAEELGEALFLARLEAALRRGLRLVQLREPRLGEPPQRLARQAIALAHRHGARVLVNGAPELARQLKADGVHLTAARLMAAATRPDAGLCAASCHNRAELDHAAALGLDFIVLGPVTATLSHPAARPLGWDAFRALAQDSPVPIFALGGLTEADLSTAYRQGAHGIAMKHGAW